MSTLVATLHEEIIAPTGPGNPRNTEGAIVALTDGRLLLGYTRYYGDGADHAAAEIVGRTSADGGYTWGAPFLLQANIGRRNVMSVSFLRLHSGGLLMGFMIKHHELDDARYHVRHSTDDGKTWSEPVLTVAEPGYVVVCNDRLVQTRSGRILVPTERLMDRVYHCVASCVYSDDDGQTWQPSRTRLDIPGRTGFQEPGIVECADGSLWMWMRNDYGVVYQSRSTDGGATWADPTPTDLAHPIAPATAKRLPDSDDLLIIYNDRSHLPHDVRRNSAFDQRRPLSAAVSHDGGRTWHHRQNIEPDDPAQSFCYSSLTFHGDTTLLTYYVGPGSGSDVGATRQRDYRLKLKIVPTAAWTRV